MSNNVIPFPEDRYFTVRKCPRVWVVELVFPVGQRVFRQRFGPNFRSKPHAIGYARRRAKRSGLPVVLEGAA